MRRLSRTLHSSCEENRQTKNYQIPEDMMKEIRLEVFDYEKWTFKDLCWRQ